MMEEHIQQAREAVVRAVQELLRAGLLFQETGGNVSVRLPGGKGVAVTPSQTAYNSMKPEDICVLGPDLAPLEDNGRKPSIESGMHALVYSERPDVHAVAHTHQKFASVFAILNKPIPALFDEVSLFIGNVTAVAPYGFSGSRQLMDNLKPLLKNQANSYILQNHGALVLGPSMEAAVRNALLLEKTAEIYCRALSTGLPVTGLPKDIQDMLSAILLEEQNKARDSF